MKKKIHNYSTTDLKAKIASVLLYFRVNQRLSLLRYIHQLLLVNKDPMAWPMAAK